MTAQRTQLSQQMQNSSGSFELVLSAVLLGLCGYFVDGWVGTRPIFMVLFTVLGFVGAAISVYYRYKHEISRLNQETIALQATARGYEAPKSEAQASSGRGDNA